MQIGFHELGSIEENKIKFVVIPSQYQGKWIFVRHKERNTWEMPGGHIEAGETAAEAAKRELYEESGADVFHLAPLCDYYVEDETSHASGMVFTARIEKLGPLPESEMAETALFEALPEQLTYPGITPVLFGFMEEHAQLAKI